ncbi:hypothetical protein MAPG_03804 [Magnaporthiopsis poae ATCC 64411]|uniref:Fungal N-terminal domain-containing protein n=1 Tax=Magnaporthiopsis poae (strain ATCC 64411 / 73-15) TaxID=644358 RepID=A0A0C4DV05_MAGP6|nr:hypothetical protein MAPG_03804 [Magnaporthiopsis poae ATCC 64411]
MADPLTVVGAATAGIQLGIGAAKSVLAVVKLLQELKDAPKEVAEIIADLTLSADRVESLVNDHSTITNDFTPEQHARLSRPAAEFKGAIETLAGKLESLTDGDDRRKRDAFKRAWNRTRYMQMRDEVRSDRQRIDRLYQEVKGVLLVIMTESLALTRDTAARTHKLVEETMVPSVRATNATVEAINDNLGSGLEGVNRRLDQICLALSTVPQQDKALDTSLVSTQVPKAVVAAKHPSLPNSGLAAQNHWAPQTVWQLGRYPSALAEACDVLQPTYRRRKPRCRCRPLTTTRFAAGGILRYEKESSSEHTSECPKSRSNSWRYSVSIMLAPFLNKAVELTLGATSGAGAWSLSPPIKFIPRVRAVDSPVYSILRSACHLTVQFGSDAIRAASAIDRMDQLCRDFEDCLQKRPTSAHEIIVDDNGKGSTIWDSIWLVTAVELFYYSATYPSRSMADYTPSWGVSLARLACKYGADPLETRGSRSGAIGLAWITDIRLKGEYHPIYDAMQSLDALELSSHIFSRHVDYDYHQRRQYIRKHPDLRAYLEADLPELVALLLLGYSTQDLSRLRSFNKNQVQTENFIYQRPGKHGILSAADMALGWSEGLEYVVGLGCDVHSALRKACASSDASSVRILLQTPSALFSPQHRPTALFVAFDCLWRKRTINIFDAVVTELASRRRMLNNLALEILEDDHCTELGLLPGKLLVRHSAQVVEAITGGYYAAEIPESLDCHSRFSTYEFLLDIEVDRPPWQRSPWPGFDCLLRAGFDDVDASDSSGETVLFKWCERLDHECFTSTAWYTALWLLHHSEQRVFPVEIVEQKRSYPGAQFYITGMVGMACMGLRTPQRFSSMQLLQEAKTALRGSDAAITDGCVCFCSSSHDCSTRGSCIVRGCCSPGGCLPHYMLSAFPKAYRGASSGDSDSQVPAAILFQTRNEALHKWARLCGISGMEKEEYYLQACRLELFERLEMAHTCCLSQTPTKEQRMLQHRICPDGSERSEMREEDKDSVRHLEAILREYRRARWRYRGKPVHTRRVKNYSAVCFWDLWLEAVDMVLPLPADELPHPHDEFFDEVLEKHFKMVHRTLECIYHATLLQMTTFIAARRSSTRAARVLTKMRQSRLDQRFEMRMGQRIKSVERRPGYYWVFGCLESKMQLRKEKRRKLEERKSNGILGRIARQQQARERSRRAIRQARGIQATHRYGKWILWVGFKKWAEALGNLTRG